MCQGTPNSVKLSYSVLQKLETSERYPNTYLGYNLQENWLDEDLGAETEIIGRKKMRRKQNQKRRYNEQRFNHYFVEAIQITNQKIFKETLDEVIGTIIGNLSVGREDGAKNCQQLEGPSENSISLGGNNYQPVQQNNQHDQLSTMEFPFDPLRSFGVSFVPKQDSSHAEYSFRDTYKDQIQCKTSEDQSHLTTQVNVQQNVELKKRSENQTYDERLQHSNFEIIDDPRSSISQKGMADDDRDPLDGTNQLLNKIKRCPSFNQDKIDAIEQDNGHQSLCSSGSQKNEPDIDYHQYKKLKTQTNVDNPKINLGKISQIGMEQMSMMESEDIYGSESNEEMKNDSQLVVISSQKEDEIQNINFRRCGTMQSKSQSKPRRDKIKYSDNQVVKMSPQQLQKMSKNSGMIRKNMFANQHRFESKSRRKMKRKNIDHFSIAYSSEYGGYGCESYQSRQNRFNPQSNKKMLTRNSRNGSYNLQVSNIDDCSQSLVSFSVNQSQLSKYMCQSKAKSIGSSHMSKSAGKKCVTQKMGVETKNLMESKNFTESLKPQENSPNPSYNLVPDQDSSLNNTRSNIQGQQDANSAYRVQFISGKVIKASKILPGFKISRDKRAKFGNKRGLSKELDRVIEKEELDYSPLKSSSQTKLELGFSHKIKVLKENQNQTKGDKLEKIPDELHEPSKTHSVNNKSACNKYQQIYTNSPPRIMEGQKTDKSLKSNLSRRSKSLIDHIFDVADSHNCIINSQISNSFTGASNKELTQAVQLGQSSQASIIGTQAVSAVNNKSPAKDKAQQCESIKLQVNSNRAFKEMEKHNLSFDDTGKYTIDPPSALQQSRMSKKKGSPSKRKECSRANSRLDGRPDENYVNIGVHGLFIPNQSDVSDPKHNLDLVNHTPIASSRLQKYLTGNTTSKNVQNSFASKRKSQMNNRSIYDQKLTLKIGQLNFNDGSISNHAHTDQSPKHVVHKSKKKKISERKASLDKQMNQSSSFNNISNQKFVNVNQRESLNLDPNSGGPAEVKCYTYNRQKTQKVNAKTGDDSFSRNFASSPNSINMAIQSIKQMYGDVRNNYKCIKNNVSQRPQIQNLGTLSYQNHYEQNNPIHTHAKQSSQMFNQPNIYSNTNYLRLNYNTQVNSNNFTNSLASGVCPSDEELIRSFHARKLSQQNQKSNFNLSCEINHSVLKSHQENKHKEFMRLKDGNLKSYSQWQKSNKYNMQKKLNKNIINEHTNQQLQLKQIEMARIYMPYSPNQPYKNFNSPKDRKRTQPHITQAHTVKSVGASTQHGQGFEVLNGVSMSNMLRQSNGYSNKDRNGNARSQPNRTKNNACVNHRNSRQPELMNYTSSSYQREESGNAAMMIRLPNQNRQWQSPVQNNAQKAAFRSPNSGLSNDIPYNRAVNLQGPQNSVSPWQPRLANKNRTAKQTTTLMGSITANNNSIINQEQMIQNTSFMIRRKLNQQNLQLDELNQTIGILDPITGTKDTRQNGFNKSDKQSREVKKDSILSPLINQGGRITSKDIYFQGRTQSREQQMAGVGRQYYGQNRQQDLNKEMRFNQLDPLTGVQNDWQYEVARDETRSLPKEIMTIEYRLDKSATSQAKSHNMKQVGLYHAPLAPKTKYKLAKKTGSPKKWGKQNVSVEIQKYAKK